VVAVSLVLGDISARKKTEEALRESEERFRIMSDGCPTMMWVTNAKGGVQFINRAFREFAGTTYEQVEGDKWQWVLHPEDAPEYVGAFQRAVGEHTPFRAEARVWRVDDAWRWVASYAEPRFSSSGEFLGHVGLSPDITERKQAEQALQISEEKFRQLAENIRDFFFILTPTANETIYVSPAFEEVWGRTLDSTYQNPMSWAEAIHPDDQEQVGLLAARQLGGELTDSQFRIRTPDGQEKWIRSRTSPVRDQAGELIRIVGIAEEITEQKRYETELIQTNRALQESEAQFRSLVEGAPDAIFVQVDYHFSYLNGAACRLFGAESPAQLLGQPIMDRFDPSMRDLIQERIRKLLQEGEPTSMVEHQWLRLDGHPVPVEVTAVPVHYQGKDGALVFARDITERKNAENRSRQLEIMAAEAQAENRAKSMFLSIMSHEIRTPMNAILGYAQLMLRDPSLGGDVKANLQIIGRSGEHLLAIINDVLDMSKIEAGRTELNPTTFDLIGLLNDLAAMFRQRAGAKALRFEMLVDGETVPYVVADEGKIRQVLSNLLGNAVKFTKLGQIVLHVTLEQRANRLWLSGLVQDTGLGVTDEEQAKLFEPFSQTQRGINIQGGTGLGLAISRKYARLMGGDITVTSQAGIGSVFRFEIPIERGDAKAAVTRNAPRRVTAIRKGQEAPKLLIVDDHPENRDWLIKLLSSIGFLVRGADNGEAAIRSWEERNPRLILMDVHMPVMRGKETIIVALTASALEDDRRNVSESGADDFLAKPCLEGELLEKLGALLNIAYEYEERSGAEDQPLAGAAALSTEKLGKLPRELIEEIRNATLSGNKRLLDKLFLEVSETGDAESARGLQELADRYEYDTLTRMLGD
jgi:PAS domain S-box-containing protein